MHEYGPGSSCLTFEQYDDMLCAGTMCPWGGVDGCTMWLQGRVDRDGVASSLMYAMMACENAAQSPLPQEPRLPAGPHDFFEAVSASRSRTDNGYVAAPLGPDVSHPLNCLSVFTPKKMTLYNLEQRGGTTLV